MGKSKKKVTSEVAAQTPSKSHQKGKRQSESDIATQQHSKKSKAAALSKSEGLQPEKDENEEEMENVEEEAPQEKMTSTLKAEKQQSLEQEKDNNDEDMNNVEEETLNVKMASPLKVDKQQGLQEEKTGNDGELNNVEEKTLKVKKTATRKSRKEQGLQEGKVDNDEMSHVGKETLKVKKTQTPRKAKKEQGLQQEKKVDDAKMNGREEQTTELDNSASIQKAKKQQGLQEEEEEEEKGLKEVEEKEENEEELLSVEEKIPEVNKKLSGEKDKKEDVPKTPVATGSKILFVGNLPYSITRDDLKDFFKGVGKVTEIRLAKNSKTSLKGFAHVEFSTEAAAKKALDKNGQMLCGRNVKLDLAWERGAHGNSSNDPNQQGQKLTAFVKGFEKKQEEDEIRNSLRKHFEGCGGIEDVRIPKDNQLKCLKGFAYVQFKDGEALSKALELNQSELGSCQLLVEEAKPNRRGRKSGKRKENPNAVDE